MRSRLLVLVAALTGSLSPGCGYTVREATAVQPNPIVSRQSTADTAKSIPLTIYQRRYNGTDSYTLRKFRFGQWAQFVAVSRDRIRFHVGMSAFNEWDVDTKDLSVFLEDSSGKRIACEDRQSPHINMYYLKLNDRYGWEYKNFIYEGMADYVFYAPGIMTKDRKDVTLVVRHSGFEYRYKWTFVADGTEVHNWGFGDHEIEEGDIPLPGPFAKYRGTIYPDEN